MIEAVLKITSENYYSCELTRIILVRINLITINGPEGFGVIESLDGTETPLRQYIKFMNHSKSVSKLEVTYKSKLEYWTRVVHSLDSASIHETIIENGCMTRLPIIIYRGYQFHTVLAPSQKKFTQMFSCLKESFSSVEIERVRRYPRGIISSSLTTKQMNAVELAYTLGYYEIPRKCDVSEIAKELGISRVATQERLRRAARTIMKEFVLIHKLGLSKQKSRQQ